MLKYKKMFVQRDAHIDSLAKMGYTITNILAESVNSSVAYNYVDTWGYGDMRFPKKLKGMMGHLLRHEIDIGGENSAKVGNPFVYF